jgi:hypothetical protein
MSTVRAAGVWNDHGIGTYLDEYLSANGGTHHDP